MSGQFNFQPLNFSKLQSDHSYNQQALPQLINNVGTQLNNLGTAWDGWQDVKKKADEAMKAQNSVTEVTNELLAKNAETLHQGSVNIAQAAERGIVDLETLQKTNLELISTLEEVREIQDTGRERRRQAESELEKIEGELKEKLLALKG